MEGGTELASPVGQAGFAPGFLVCEKSNLSPVGSTVNGKMNRSLGRKRLFCSCVESVVTEGAVFVSQWNQN